MEKPVLIYGLVDPRDGQLRYIWKTIDPTSRLAIHCTRGHGHVGNWIKSLRPLKPVMVEIEWVSNVEWVEAEQFWIAYFKAIGVNLTNLTDGGEGLKNYKATDETRQKLSSSRKGRFGGKDHPRYGKPVSQEQRAKQSASHKGNLAKEKHHLWGKHHSEETKKKIAQSTSIRRFTDTQVRQIREDPRANRIIGDEYGVFHTVIWKIKNHVTYRTVT